MERFKRTEAAEKRVISAYKRTGTYKKTAAELGVGVNTVQRICVKYGVNRGQGNHMPGNSGGGSPMKVTDQQILEAVKTMTRQEIAERYNIHVEALARRMRRLGVHAQRKRR